MDETEYLGVFCSSLLKLFGTTRHMKSRETRRDCIEGNIKKNHGGRTKFEGQSEN